MGLIDRDYMYENREDPIKTEKDILQQELFSLYEKKEKSHIDKKRIKEIENIFMNRPNEKPKPSYIKIFIMIAILLLMFYQPISELIAYLIILYL